jgi:phosphoribosylformylglycinamidine cyclo-ligase
MGAVARARDAIRSTFTPGVVGDVGGFGGLFRPDFRGLSDPILVASADGVGTKIKVAITAGVHDTVGQDLVNHCVNDILVQGARPLFFLDYVAMGKMDGAIVGRILEGVAKACRENGCALLGGETAEMPGFYQPGDYELVGFIVGMVDRPRVLDGSKVAPGDVLVGLPSSGLHTNGYSLARRILFDRLGLKVGERAPWQGKDRKTVGELLLEPHLSYLKPLRPLLGHKALHGIAHITGGGLTDNLPRLLPPDTHAWIRVGSWPVPELFHFLQEKGEIATDEMLRVFNMGIGMVLMVEPAGLAEVLGLLRSTGQRSFLIGTVQKGAGGVVYDLGTTSSETET